MPRVSGTIRIERAVVVEVISIDRRWRDLGRPSVVLELRLPGEPPDRRRVSQGDIVNVAMNVTLGDAA
jgi:hypothetical protein